MPVIAATIAQGKYRWQVAADQGLRVPISCTNLIMSRPVGRFVLPAIAAMINVCDHGQRADSIRADAIWVTRTSIRIPKK
ncbi:MAG: hypothetical protein KKC01_01380 [Gammaproteobacteria bacterium]|nr:hypothetical protein [Gammaproteobacteria bacterium]